MTRTDDARAPVRILALALCALASLGIPAGAAATPPTIESEWVTDVTQHNAVLHAEINPNGSLTKYKLQFDESGAFQFYQPDCGVLHVPGYAYCMHVVPGDERTEPPEGSIPAGNDAVEVSANLASIGATLQPNTTYHYRAIAANGELVVEGPDQTFTTSSSPPPPTAPTIESESVSNVTPTNATLEAEINPEGAANGVFYQFQLLLDPGEASTELACPSSPPPGFSVCVGPNDPEALPLELITGDETQTVKLDLASAGVSLEPGRTYFFRVLAADRVFSEDTAEWESPAVVGPSKDFTTPGPPSIEGVSAKNITATDATLEAQINPGGLETTYEFRLETPECAMQAGLIVGCQLVGAGTIPAGSSTQTVSTDIAQAWQDLSPNTTYTYAVFATNSAGPASGRHEGSFETTTAASPTLVPPASCAFSTTCVGGPTNAPPASACKKGWVKRYGKCVREPRCGRKLLSSRRAARSRRRACRRLRRA